MRKVIIIAIAVIIVVVAGYLLWPSKSNQLNPQEKACVNSGGTVSTSKCCKSASDFPNSCAIGACGCSPENSHEVKICDCGDGCWNGTKCVNNNREINETSTEQAIKEILAEKYDKDIADVVVNITNSNELYAVGSVFFKENGVQGEGGMFLAVMGQDGWQVVFDGNGSVDCELMKNTYMFTSEMLTGFCD